MTTGAELVVDDIAIADRDGRTIVDGVSLRVSPGTTTGVVGQSGSGKSLTCRSLLGILPDNLVVSRGSIHFGETDLLALDYRAWQRIRGPRIGAVFQDPASYLKPFITVGHQLAEAFRVHTGMKRSVATAAALDLIERIGLRDPRRVYRQFSFELSGGMLQRIAIAIAVAGRPEILIADEATTALDVTVQAEVLDLLSALREQFQLGLLFVSHDLAVVAQVSDYVVVMQNGRIVEQGDAKTVLGNPTHPHTRSLVSKHEQYGIEKF